MSSQRRRLTLIRVPSASPPITVQQQEQEQEPVQELNQAQEKRQDSW